MGRKGAASYRSSTGLLQSPHTYVLLSYLTVCLPADVQPGVWGGSGDAQTTGGGGLVRGPTGGDNVHGGGHGGLTLAGWMVGGWQAKWLSNGDRFQFRKEDVLGERVLHHLEGP